MLNPLNILGITLYKQPQLLVKPIKDLVFPIVSLYQKTLRVDQALPLTHQWIALATRITLGIGFAFATQKICDWVERKGILKAQKFLNEKFAITIFEEIAQKLPFSSSLVPFYLITFLGNRLDSKTTAYMEFAYSFHDNYQCLKYIVTLIKNRQLPSLKDSFVTLVFTLLKLNTTHACLYRLQVSQYAAQILKTVTQVPDPVAVDSSLLTLDQVAEVVTISNSDRQLPIPKILDLIYSSSEAMRIVRYKAATPGFLTPLIEGFAGALAPSMARVFGYTRV